MLFLKTLSCKVTILMLMSPEDPAWQLRTHQRNTAESLATPRTRRKAVGTCLLPHSPARFTPHAWRHMVFIFSQTSLMPIFFPSSHELQEFQEIYFTNSTRIPVFSLPRLFSGGAAHFLPELLAHVILPKMNFTRTRDGIKCTMYSNL